MTTDQRTGVDRRQQPSLSSDRIQDALYGFTRSRLLFAAVDLGIFTLIAQGKNTLEALTAEAHADRRAMRIFLDGLVGIGFLGKSGEAYRLPEDVAHYLVADSPSYMGGMVKHGKRLYDNWALLRDVVRSGLPAGGAQVMAHIEEYFAELVKGLYVSSYDTAHELASMLGIGTEYKGLSILDVAGGSAVWSIACLEKDDTSKATVIDYPRIISVTQEYVAKHHLSDRYSYIAGDLEVLEFPQSQFDLAIVANICHAIGPQATGDLVRDVATTLKPGGRVAIIDFVPDDARSKPGWPLIFGVNMLISTDEGDVFTESQYKAWLQAAGLTFESHHRLESEVSLVVGKK